VHATVVFNGFFGRQPCTAKQLPRTGGNQQVSTPRPRRRPAPLRRDSPRGPLRVYRNYTRVDHTVTKCLFLSCGFSFIRQRNLEPISPPDEFSVPEPHKERKSVNHPALKDAPPSSSEEGYESGKSGMENVGRVRAGRGARLVAQLLSLARSDSYAFSAAALRPAIRPKVAPETSPVPAG
jgi:hypothetical protein